MIDLNYFHSLALLESWTSSFVVLSDVYEFKLPLFPKYAIIGQHLDHEIRDVQEYRQDYPVKNQFRVYHQLI